MGRGTFLFVALMACHSGRAEAQGTPDGYACSATAFSNLGGLDAVGTGEIEMIADAAYTHKATRFSYSVRDRISRHTRMHATWNLIGGSPDSFGPIQLLRFPFHLGAPTAVPASVTFSLDGSPAAPLPAANMLERAPDGRITAVAARARDGNAPELRGHRSLGYLLARADGARVAEDFFLLPDWRRASGPIRTAIAQARSLLRGRRCNPFYVLRPPS